MRVRLLASVLLASLVLGAVPTAAQPGPGDVVCATNSVDNPARESRYFCEPMDSTFFVQFDQFIDGLETLQAAYPDFIEVKEIGRSARGLPIMFVEVTNEASSVPRDGKLQLGYSASIHANEPAGREGMVRVIEDLAAAKGPYGAALKPLLDRIIVNVWFPNPDSWAQGDFLKEDPTGVATGLLDGNQSVMFVRANANGYDLNRQFPNPGWILPEHEPMSQPEVRPVVEELRYSGNHQNMVAAADLHGMLNSPNMIRSIIPNQDYDFRRMVLVVEQLREMQVRVEANPSFTEWQALAAAGASFEQAIGALPQDCLSAPGLPETCPPTADAPIQRPFLWGARWDQIGYTDTGFTSDYLTLSPRSPTGGMGAVGQIVEFAYSHEVPNNKYVAKLVDMHTAGVREIVRTQMEQAFRLDSPVLAGTGTVGYAWVDDPVSDKDDPNAYGWDNATGTWTKPMFDRDDPDAKFDFRQVAYNVSNLNFWRDLGTYAADPFVRVDAAGLTAADLEGLAHFAITDQAIDALSSDSIAAIRTWVEAGGHVLLTDKALQFLDRAGITKAAVFPQCVYIGHSDLADRTHPLLAGVDWNARVTGEASATGFGATEGSGRNYPAWGVTNGAFRQAGGQIVGTTQAGPSESPSCTSSQAQRLVSLGRVPLGAGSIDILGSALPRPTQAYDHRYGLADYSVSALVYWVVMNSLGGHVEMMAIPEPFIPVYEYDPVNAPTQDPAADGAGTGKDTPAVGLAVLLAALAAAFVVARRR